MDYNGNTSNMASDFAADLLYGFDIKDEDSLDFLKSLIAAGRVPQAELREVFQLGLLRGTEEWDMICDCAVSMRNQHIRENRADPDVIPYLAYVLSGRSAGSQLTAGKEKEKTKKRQRKKSEPKSKTSGFWEDDGNAGSKLNRVLREKPGMSLDIRPPTKAPVELSNGSVQDSASTSAQLVEEDPSSFLENECGNVHIDQVHDSRPSSPSTTPLPLLAHYHSPTLKRTRSFKSPFFTPSPTKKIPRPARGTISSLPFPPLSASRFGLIQESLSHDPFRLLVAVTFLIRTTGKAAIPVFRRVMERFPTPQAFAGADMETELVPMIAHLGLPAVRCAAIGKYARIWIETPPEPGVTYVVKGYPRNAGCRVEDVKPPGEDDCEVKAEKDGEDSGVLQQDEVCDSESKLVAPESPESGRKHKSRPRLNSSEWEIGHLTQGRYAIDSWRIFCRDIFLGKSGDWMGPSHRQGRVKDEVVVEPEWKRVLPEDKELRACLRWMWMRDGFEWDPVTGRRSPLREEMRAAVEDGRVKYDDKGELVILDPPSNAGVGCV
jgi:hypothetical protein